MRILFKVFCLLFITSSVYAQSTPPLRLKDEGSNVGYINSVNCVGSAIACTKSGVNGTMTISTTGFGWTDGGSTVYLTTTSDAVAIGTTTAPEELSIQSSQPRIWMKDPDGGAAWATRVADTSGANSQYLIQSTTDNSTYTTRLIIDQATGGVTVGTTSSGTGAVDIRGDEVRIWAGTGSSNNALSSGELYVEGDFEVDGTAYSGTFVANGSGNSYLNYNTGNVGIGTDSPTGKLDVRGDETRIWTGVGTDSNALAAGELYVEGDVEVDGTVYMASCSGAGCGGGADTNAEKEFWWEASATLASQAADAIAPISKIAGTNVDVYVASFDAAADECRAMQFKVPSDVKSGSTITFRNIWFSQTATSGNVIWDWRYTATGANGETWDAALTTKASAASAVQGTVKLTTQTTATESLATLGWATNDLITINVCRDADNGSDTLVGDAELLGVGVEIPRE